MTNDLKNKIGRNGTNAWTDEMQVDELASCKRYSVSKSPAWRSEYDV